MERVDGAQRQTGGALWAKLSARRLIVSSLPWPLRGLSLPMKGWGNLLDRTEHRLETGPQRRIGFVHRDGQTQVHQTGHPVLGDAAGDDSAEMAKVRLDVQRNAMERHPA